jgi:predicted Zn finger-like uncharacterized protein
VIVTCGQCTTQFKLDDAKIPSGGARVRCSRCQHSFFIEPPHQDDPTRIDDLTRDVAPPSGVESAVESNAASEEAEDDWKFNEDAPAAEEPGVPPAPGRSSGLEAAQDAVNDLLGGDVSSRAGATADLVVEGLGGADLDSGDLDLDLAEPAATVSPASAIPEPADPIVGPGEATDRSDPLGIEAQIESDAPVNDRSLAAPETGGEDASELGSKVESLAGGDIDDDLGSPRNWDFFAQGEGEAESKREKTAVARVDLVPRWKLIEQEQEQERAREIAALDDAAVAPDLDIQPGSASRVLRQAGHGLGWIATVALVAAAVWSTLGPNRIDRSPAAPLQALGDLQAEIVASGWIDNAVAGPVYVVSGQLRGSGNGEPVTLGGLGIELLDASGAALALPVTLIADPFHPIDLREHAPDALARDVESGARSLARNRLGSGDAVPFQAVFADLPPEAVRFRLIQTPITPEAAPPAQAPATEPDSPPSA